MDSAQRGLVRVAVQLTGLLDLGYTDCVVSAAASCRDLMTSLRAEGFLVVLTLPRSTNMVDLGLTDTHVLVKNFAPRNLRKVGVWLKKYEMSTLC